MLEYNVFKKYYWVYIKRIQRGREWYEYTKVRLLFINDRKFLLWRNTNENTTNRFHIIDFQSRILICTGSTIKKAIEALDRDYNQLIAIYGSTSYKGHCNVTYNEILKRKILDGMEDDFAKDIESFDEYMEVK